MTYQAIADVSGVSEFTVRQATSESLFNDSEIINTRGQKRPRDGRITSDARCKLCGTRTTFYNMLPRQFYQRLRLAKLKTRRGRPRKITGGMPPAPVGKAVTLT